MNLWPPGSCPPTALLTGDGCDLGAILLRDCYTAEHIEGVVRSRLQARLGECLDQGRTTEAAQVLQALLDTWPIAALVDAAGKLWSERAAAVALPVLGRAAEVLCVAHGWDALPDGPWPVPDAQWVAEHTDPGVTQICRRAEQDGSDALASTSDMPVIERPWALPAVEAVSAEDLVAHRAELAHQLVHARIAAVRVQGEIPDTPEAALALGELRLEGLAQQAFEAFGVAGLLAPRAPRWSQLLRPAQAGADGAVLSQTCHTAIMPGPPSALMRGEVRAVGWLLWRGPHAALPVQPEAVAVLAALDGVRDLEAVAAHLGAPLSSVQAMAAQLVAVGAATA